MKLSEWLSEWSMSSLKIKASFLEMEWAPNDQDRNAAWDLYVEMLTRVATQHLEPESGDEQTSLESIHCLFSITREILKRQGRQCLEFAKIAIVILNQVIRPFTAKWHKRFVGKSSLNSEESERYRKELARLQVQLRKYTKMLADMAGVEDLSEIESNG